MSPEGKGRRWLGLTTLLPTCAGCLDIEKPESPGTHKAFSGLLRDLCMCTQQKNKYEGWNFNSGNYLFTTDTK